MRYLVGKIMMCLACAIILMHALIPHHHHDMMRDMGLVYESEINCICDKEINCVGHDCGGECEHNHDIGCAERNHDESNHPFGSCKLQELLSHLVLTNKDKHFLLDQSPSQHYILLLFAGCLLGDISVLSAPQGQELRQDWPSLIVTLPAICAFTSHPHRGPPSFAC